MRVDSRDSGLGFGDWGLWIGDWGMGIRDSGLEAREWGTGARESGLGNPTADSSHCPTVSISPPAEAPLPPLPWSPSTGQPCKRKAS